VLYRQREAKQNLVHGGGAHRHVMASYGYAETGGCRTRATLELLHSSSDDGYLLRNDLHALYNARLLTINADNAVQLDPGVIDHAIKVNRKDA
jgi:hypothetical protein